MAGYILARLVSLIFVLFVVSLIAFLLMHAVPGGPFDLGERRLPEATRQAQLEKYGLDQPLLVQYGKYMWHALQGDFGVPFQSPTRTVTELIADTWPVTIRIGICTIAVSFGFGILFGFIGALRHNTWLDYGLTFGASLGYVVPNFVVAVWLILLFSFRLEWLPAGGWGEWKHYILPVMAYSLAPMSLVARYTRVSLLEVMRADYVRTAYAKGLRERSVVLGHVLRVALLPVVTIMAIQFGQLLGGAVVTEAIFGWPGIGRLIIDSIGSREYLIVQSTMLLFVTVFVLLNILADVCYALLDPRIRLGS